MALLVLLELKVSLAFVFVSSAAIAVSFSVIAFSGPLKHTNLSSSLF